MEGKSRVITGASGGYAHIDRRPRGGLCKIGSGVLIRRVSANGVAPRRDDQHTRLSSPAVSPIEDGTGHAESVYNN
jgi:hypothetical protein